MLYRWIVSAASRLVPRADRRSWRAEWEAELAYREQRRAAWARGGPDLVWRSLGAFRDAWTLQLGQWHSARFYARHWRLTATALVSLTLAITVTIVALAIGDALLLRAPGVRDPKTVRSIYLRTTEDQYGSVSYEEFQYYRANARTFSGITAYPFSISTLSVNNGAGDQQVLGTQVADNYFQVLGPAAARGTLSFTGTDRDTVVIGQRLWERLGRPAVPGTNLTVNGHPVAVAGVVPASFQGTLFVFSADIWMPFRTAEHLLGQAPTMLTDPSQRWLHMAGRLAPSATESAAAAETRLLSAGWSTLHPSPRPAQAFLTAMSVTPPGDREWTLLLVGTLIGAVLLMLVVACANVTNLLLGLSIARRYEFLVRVAVGAARRHLVLPVLRESLALALIAGALGYAIAYRLLALLSAIQTAVVVIRMPLPGLDARPGAATTVAIAGLVVVCGLLIGAAPALRAARDGLTAGVSHTSTTRHSPARVRGTLVIVQMIAATLVLAVLTVSISSVLRLRHAPLGFSAKHLAFTSIDVRRTGYDENTGRQFYDRVRERITRIPGVEAVSIADGPPLGNGWRRDTISPADGRGAGGTRDIRTSFVDERYFTTMGIALRAGRTFNGHDTSGAPEVVVVNETMAHQYWPGSNPIGQRLRVARDDRIVTVVGVAADGTYDEVGEAPGPFIYYAVSQHYLNTIVAIARTSAAGPAPLTIAQALGKMEPRLVFATLGPVSLDDLLAFQMFFAWVVVLVAAVVSVMTLILAVAGLYSSTFYSVEQRRHEFGIRLMLGAGARDIYRAALASIGWTATIGAVTGLALASGVLPLVASVFYGIRSFEPLITLEVAAAGVLIVLATTFVVVRPLTLSGELAGELRS